ncbi:hypothetical protein GCM10017620_24680 [Brevundimonas intermedia]|uniref:Phage gp6-like head-tail connector protein n=1 Tax=Brevundimonas intermedia TaxID=74315 RepID=A0ABQ5T9L5_9CAUL|nr:phage head-tail connector protein [Brevundimonas intermedia]GLK49495.1 hypothetical protein GCM10017620_24680 [Brevundimonas intermedia]
MSVLVVTPPAPLIDFKMVKDHLKLDSGDEDTLLESYIAAASGWIDNPLGWLGRAILTQTLELRVADFSDAECLPHGPISSIESVKYLTPAGVEETLPDNAYRLDGQALVATGSWPALRGDAEGVRVRYVVGGAEAPAPVQQAALLLIGQWHANRASVVIGTIVNQMPFGIEALLQPYRKWHC